MATLEQLSAALIKADAAGNAADAKVFADEIRRLKSAQAPVAAPAALPTPAPAPVQTGIPIGRRIIETVEPTVEMLGAAGGGMLGTPLGPAGVVGGAGLGYGMAKTGLRALKSALGYEQGPQSVGEALTTGAQDVLTGATMEAGGRVVAPLIAKGVGAIADMRQIPKQKAAEIARNALGPDLEAVKNALAQAPANVTAAQATAALNSPTWQALLQRAGQRDPRFLQALESSQGDVSLNALAKLAGGTTATETRATSELAKSNLNKITGPMREASLKRADLGKYVADEAGARAANDLAVLAGSGAKIDPAQFAAQATGAEKALRSVGIKPLESDSLIRSISATADNPAFAGNDLISGAVKNVADDIAKWTGQGGIIDAAALDAIRKNSVNAAIAQLRPGADATAQRNLAAGVLSKIKPAIDDAIEAAGGTGWRDYLNMHAKGMRDIAEKNLTGQALNMWKTNKDAFVKLVQGESPEVVEKTLGPGSYDIAKELSDKTMATLQDQAAKVIRDAAIKNQASAGQDALKELLLQQISKVRIPSYLSAVASTTNKALQILEDKIGTKTMDMLTKASQTPQGAAELLDTLPAKDRVRILNLLSNPQNWKTSGGAVAVKNALAPEEPQNALAK